MFTSLFPFLSLLRASFRSLRDAFRWEIWKIFLSLCRIFSFVFLKLFYSDELRSCLFCVSWQLLSFNWLEEKWKKWILWTSWFEFSILMRETMKYRCSFLPQERDSGHLRSLLHLESLLNSSFLFLYVISKNVLPARRKLGNLRWKSIVLFYYRKTRGSFLSLATPRDYNGRYLFFGCFFFFIQFWHVFFFIFFFKIQTLNRNLWIF